MAITYHDHLIDAITDNVIATNLVTNPRSMGTPTDLTFGYKLSFDSSRLNLQAESFADLIRMNPSINSEIDRYISLKFDQRKQAISDAYKYSYFKTIVAINNLKESGFNYFGAVPTNTNVFYGHKVLFYVYMNANTFSPSINQTTNVYLTRMLEIEQDIMDKISKEEVYIKSVNNVYPGGIFNDVYERILSAFRNINSLEVSYLSDKSDIPLSSIYNPLGSMSLTDKISKPLLFSPEDDCYATVSTPRSLTDYDSKFWNTANFISIHTMPDEYSNYSAGSPYIYVKKTLVNVATIIAEVSAITGLSQGGFYTTFGSDIPKPQSGNINTPNFKPKGPSGPNINSGGKGSNNKPSSGGNKMDSRLYKAVKSSSRALGRALTSNEAKAFIHSAAASILNSKLSEHRMEQLVNRLMDSKVVTENKELRSSFGVVGGGSSRKSITFNNTNSAAENVE